MKAARRRCSAPGSRVVRSTPGGERLERLDRPLWVGAAADDDEQGGTARLERLVDLAEEPLVEPERGQPRARRSGDSADGGEQHGREQQHPQHSAPMGASRTGCTTSTRPSWRR